MLFLKDISLLIYEINFLFLVKYIYPEFRNILLLCLKLHTFDINQG